MDVRKHLPITLAITVVVAVTAAVTFSEARLMHRRRHWLSPVKWTTPLLKASHPHRPRLITNCPADFDNPLLGEAVEGAFDPQFTNAPAAPSMTIVDDAGHVIFASPLGQGSAGHTAAILERALQAAGRPVDASLHLLAEEDDAVPKQQATFTMPCFWRGEGELGAIDGVIATVPGSLGTREGVVVTFNPAIVSYDQLLAQARSAHVADDAFGISDESTFHAGAVCAQASQQATLHADDGPKYYLQNTPLRAVPMTSTQACRVNGALGHHTSPLMFLSPHQRELAETITAHPDASWPNAVGVPLGAAWEAAVDAAG